ERTQKVEEFVSHGYNLNILPLPGDVDVISRRPSVPRN
ncbi:hypothetical protein IFM89_021390, partial [Coptis chinensis]